MSTERLPGLELLRFIAAFAVLLAHYNHFFIYGYAYDGLVFEKQPLFALFSPFYHYGTRAVEVFWCLSGFIFFYRYGRLNDRRLSFRNFFWLRFSRLYPLHLATLVLVALLQWAYHHANGSYFVVELNNAKHFILNLFFASYWGLQDGFSFNAPVWSVSLEVLVYGIFFGISYRLGTNLFVAGICLIACLAIDRLVGREPVLVRCLFYFYAGGIGCCIFRSARTRGRTIKICAAAGAAAAVGFSMFEFLRNGNLDWILDLGVPSGLVAFALASPLFPKPLAAASDALGNLTYASYLVHFPFQVLIMLIVGLFAIPHSFASSPYFLCCYLLAVLLMSHAVYVKFEKPAQMLIRKKMLLG